MRSGYAEGPFALHRIRNDQVEHELSYARTGSAIPASLHGIWWMDQRGVHLPQPSDPEYRQVVESSADELLVTWGDGAGWDPATRCVGRVPIYGGAAGHWTFMDVSASGTSGVFSSALDNRAMLDFCFTDHTMQTMVQFFVEQVEQVFAEVEFFNRSVTQAEVSHVLHEFFHNLFLFSIKVIKQIHEALTIQ